MIRSNVDQTIPHTDDLTEGKLQNIILYSSALGVIPLSITTVLSSNIVRLETIASRIAYPPHASRAHQAYPDPCHPIVDIGEREAVRRTRRSLSETGGIFSTIFTILKDCSQTQVSYHRLTC